MFDYPDNKQMNLQKVLWYALVGSLMVLASIGGAWASSLTRTVAQDHTSIAVLAEELHQLHQDMEDIKVLLKNNAR